MMQHGLKIGKGCCSQRKANERKCQCWRYPLAPLTFRLTQHFPNENSVGQYGTVQLEPNGELAGP
jgi:hypothetical protein